MFKSSRGVASIAISCSLLLTGCAGGASQQTVEVAEITTLRLGYFPNLTHAAALVGVQQGYFKDALKDLDVSVTPTIFNAGPDAVTALFGESIDCSYIGPNPAINAYAQSQGSAIRVVSGASSAGAALVVRKGIGNVSQLKGKTLATPQLGNTQDVALRAWLLEQGVETDSEGGGEISIRPQSNSEGLAAFSAGTIDGAWVPQPWVAEYEAAGAEILLNEKDLWPSGKFVTAHIVCRTKFIEEHPEVVKALVQGNIEALDYLNSQSEDAQVSFALALSAITGTSPKPEILSRAWEDLEFTYDPIATSLVKSAEDAVKVGLLDSASIDDAGGLPGTLYSLEILNEVLEEQGKPKVK